MLILLILALAYSPLSSHDTQLASPRQVRSGQIRGVIVDAHTGRPLARVRVLVQNSTIATQTNDEGRLSIDVPAGTVTLSVSAVGYALTKRDLTVPAGGTLDLTIPISEGTGGYTETVHVTGDLFPREAPGVPTEQSLGSADLQNLKNTLADDPM